MKILFLTLFILMSFSAIASDKTNSWIYNNGTENISIHDDPSGYGEEWIIYKGEKLIITDVSENAYEAYYSKEGESIRIAVKIGRGYQEIKDLILISDSESMFDPVPDYCTSENTAFLLEANDTTGKISGYCLTPCN